MESPFVNKKGYWVWRQQVRKKNFFAWIASFYRFIVIFFIWQFEDELQEMWNEDTYIALASQLGEFSGIFLSGKKEIPQFVKDMQFTLKEEDIISSINTDMEWKEDSMSGKCSIIRTIQ
jgi:hypothetical protein